MLWQGNAAAIGTYCEDAPLREEMVRLWSYQQFSPYSAQLERGACMACALPKDLSEQY